MIYLYYIALIVPAILFLIPSKLKSDQKLVIGSIPMIMIIIFRFGSGSDYFSYEYIYNQFDITSIQTILANKVNVELGYRLLMIFPKLLKLPFHIFISVLGLFIFFLFYKWIRNSSKLPILSILLFYSMFFIVWNLSAIRQGLVLAIGTYFFYNSEIEFSRTKKVFIILILATIHSSALIYLLFVFVDIVKWDRKRILTVFVSSVLISFLPLDKILQSMSFIHEGSKIVYYVTNNVPTFNFAGVARLLMFSFVFLGFVYIDNDDYSIKLANHFMLGNALFFLFKFSEIISARLSIYTFILAPVLFVNIFKSIGFKKLTKIFVSISIVFVSTVFFQKEVSGYQYQVGIIEKKQFLEFESIFNYDRNNYYNRYNNLTFQINKCIDRKILFKEEIISKTKLVEYSPLDIPILVKHRNRYGVINQKSEWLLEPSIVNPPTLAGTILKTGDVYLDITNSNRTQNQLKFDFEKEQALDYEFESREMKKLDMLFKDLHISSKRLILEPHLIKQAEIYYSDIGLPHYVAKFSYLAYDAYLYMNQDQRPLYDRIYPNLGSFDRHGIMRIKGYCGIESLSIDGSLIWME